MLNTFNPEFYSEDFSYVIEPYGIDLHLSSYC